ncbi:MAG: signal peptide peptidase SppA [Candidatus Pacebacteria bacterium]|nr:signal peptide peptidase SppA [Candidatus Paceibacterota bacterium]
MSFGRELASVLLKVFAVLLTIVIIIGMIGFFSFNLLSVSDGECNIAVMPINGVIMPFGSGVMYEEFVTTPADVRDFLAALEYETMIEGVLFEINSPGGTPVASEDIATQIAVLEMPNIALVGDVAASGGYMIASAADTIVASPMSDVGSIGVTMSYTEESEKNKEEGITYVPLNSGKFKDTGSPNKPLSEEERTLLEGQLQEVHNYFVDLVSKYRNINRDDVAALADGSTLTGTKAQENKLVDILGGREAAKEAFAVKLGKDKSGIKFCEYVPPLI